MILCFLGWHKWGVWKLGLMRTQDHRDPYAWVPHEMVYRVCLKCKKQQVKGYHIE